LEAAPRASSTLSPRAAAVPGTRTEAPVEWAIGSVVAGKYEVVSRLGAGGFGTVYKVRHLFRKKYYALKTPHLEFARDETFRVRFEREIEAMERFVHTDAVMIRDSGLTERGTPYYTMDFIEGESLKVLLRRELRLAVDRALDIIRRVLRVLDIAHAHQIIHRDIKPDNILVTNVAGREAIKVLDFGVAKLLDLVGETGSVTKGSRVGTPKYMSPEQILGEPLDARSDIFSLGIVFYELITGDHPFARVSDPVRVTAAILHKDPLSPRAALPDLSPEIESVLRRMIEKRPEDRPASAAALLRELSVIDGGPSRASPIRSVALVSGIARAPAVSLVLRIQSGPIERRSFMIFSDVLRFGRTNDPERGIVNEVILRRLPCRSEAADPENWRKNLTISGQQGCVRPDGEKLVIEPSAGSRYGILIDGMRTMQPVEIHTDRFHITLGDRALEIDGHRRLPTPEEPSYDLRFLAAERPAALAGREFVGYSNPRTAIDWVHFSRADNCPEHDYFLVLRRLEVGSSVNCGLRLDAPGVDALHALILYDGGEAFLLAVNAQVLFREATAEAAYGVPRLGDPRLGDPKPSTERTLAPRELLPLRPGLDIEIGGVRILVSAADDGFFKTP
jgi:serine/threonine protein kinase